MQTSLLCLTLNNMAQVVLQSLAESSIRSLHSRGIGTQGVMTDAATALSQEQPAPEQQKQTDEADTTDATPSTEQQARRMMRFARLPGRRFGRRAPPMLVINNALEASKLQQRRDPSRLSIATSVTGLEVSTAIISSMHENHIDTS